MARAWAAMPPSSSTSVSSGRAAAVSARVVTWAMSSGRSVVRSSKAATASSMLSTVAMMRATASCSSSAATRALTEAAAPSTSDRIAVTWSGIAWVPSADETVRRSARIARSSPGMAWVSSLATSRAEDCRNRLAFSSSSSIGRLLIRSSASSAVAETSVIWLAVVGIAG